MLFKNLRVTNLQNVNSFAVYSEHDEKYVGICLNFDAYDEPEVHINSNLAIIFEFLESLEAPIR